MIVMGWLLAIPCIQSGMESIGTNATGASLGAEGAAEDGQSDEFEWRGCDELMVVVHGAEVERGQDGAVHWVRLADQLFAPADRT
jgi:hypothetical protein